MSPTKRKFIARVEVLCVAVLLAALVSLVPDIVSRFSYAAERGKAEAAREQLSRAADLTEAFQNVADALRPSVVSISSVKKIRPMVRRPDQQFREWPEEFGRFFGDDFFDRFFQYRIPEGGFEQRGLGTGVIVNEDGYILTNDHVVAGADEVTVILSDDRRFTAEVVGTDDKSDVAVLKVDAEHLVPAQLGDSDSIKVGEWVLAIGSPFGLDQTVTAGIVSAKGRANVGIADYEDFIQTDAAINPGNSGGPLVNMEGQVIGINTAIASRSGGYVGIGFAIPSNMARTIMENIIDDGRVERGWLGAMIQDLSEDLAESFEFDSTDGALVGDVVPDGPADKAGLRAGDIITKFNGKPVQKAAQLRNAVASTAPETKAKLEVFRDGEIKSLTVTIGLLESQFVAGKGTQSALDLGMTVQTLTPEMARQAGFDEDEKGVIVTQVEPGSLAARVGIRSGDLIVAVGTTRINDLTDFREAMKEEDVKRGVRMQVKREGIQRFVFMKNTD
ncbi:MAG: DegQ family serine endoprotease [Sedimentisphaerales bacterium]|nr:DegQ family serine endoprotease [Sedimentisphaerales bacterium]